MSGRFEKVITGAVLAGALALTGCDGDAVLSRGLTGNTDNTSPALAAAALINGRTQIQLTFSEPVVIAVDQATIQSEFKLIGTGSFFCSTCSPTISYYDNKGPLSRHQFCDSTAGSFCSFSFASYSAQTLGSISIFGGEPGDTMIIPLNFLPVNPGADFGTGFVRLHYRNQSDSITDPAGNPLQALGPGNTTPGNVVF